MSEHAPDDADGAAPLPRLPWYHRAPVLTMALNCALILTIFLTRERWAAWVVESEWPHLCGHVRHAVMSQDGKRAVVLSEVYDAVRCHVCDLERATTLASFESQKVNPWEAYFHPGFRFGAEVASSRDSFAFLIQRLTTDEGVEHAYSYGHFKESVRVVSLRDGAIVCTLEGHGGRFHSAEYSPDGKHILTAGADEAVRVWDAGTGKCTLVIGTGHVYSASYFPDGERLVAFTRDGIASVRDAGTGRLIADLPCGSKPSRSVLFISKGRRMLSRSPEGLKLWDTSSYDLVATLARPIGGAIAASDGHMAAAMGDGTVRVWDAETGRNVALLKIPGDDHEVRIPWIKFSPDGSQIATRWMRGDRGGIYVWEAGTGALVCAIPENWDCEYAPDGNRILTYDRKHAGYVRDSRTGHVLLSLSNRASFMGDRRLFVFRGISAPTVILRRIRPEWWWGVFWLWHFWLIVALSLAVAWSGWRDIKRTRREADAPANANGPTG